MGYDVHITRADQWFESRLAGRDIRLGEWRAYVARDTEFHFADHREDAAVWTAYSRDAESEVRAYFLWQGGMISVPYPDDEIMRKMLRVANALGARVQGDELEIYFERDGRLYSSDGVAESAFTWSR